MKLRRTKMVLFFGPPSRAADVQVANSDELNMDIFLQILSLLG